MTTDPFLKVSNKAEEIIHNNQAILRLLNVVDFYIQPYVNV